MNPFSITSDNCDCRLETIFTKKKNSVAGVKSSDYFGIFGTVFFVEHFCWTHSFAFLMRFLTITIFLGLYYISETTLPSSIIGCLIKVVSTIFLKWSGVTIK